MRVQELSQQKAPTTNANRIIGQVLDKSKRIVQRRETLNAPKTSEEARQKMREQKAEQRRKIKERGFVLPIGRPKAVMQEKMTARKEELYNEVKKTVDLIRQKYISERMASNLTEQTESNVSELEEMVEDETAMAVDNLISENGCDMACATENAASQYTAMDRNDNTIYDLNTNYDDIASKLITEIHNEEEVR